jgi:hypothetical protein
MTADVAHAAIADALSTWQQAGSDVARGFFTFNVNTIWESDFSRGR